MKTLRNWMFALIMLMSFALSPAASADGGSATPDCKTNPDACQAMLAQYEELYGPLPSPTPTPVVTVEPVVKIEMLPGTPPSAEVQAQMDEFHQELQEIARTVCTDPEDFGWQQGIRDELSNGRDHEELMSLISTMSGYADIEASANNYVVAINHRDGYALPSRVPTFVEAIEPYIGCDTGEYLGK